MNWLDTLSNGWDAIRTHKLRSALTSLGILMGIAAVVLTVGLGQGAQQQVSKQLSALGGNLLIVSPGSSTTQRRARRLRHGGDADHGRRHRAELDAGRTRHRRSRAGVVDARPSRWSTARPTGRPRWSARPRSGCRSEVGRCEYGRFIDADDQTNAAAVVVLASDTATELFGPFDPVGQSVTINSVPVPGRRRADLGRFGLDHQP